MRGIFEIVEGPVDELGPTVAAGSVTQLLELAAVLSEGGLEHFVIGFEAGDVFA